MSWNSNDVEVWMEASVTAGQADDTRDVFTSLTSAGTDIPLQIGVAPGDCTVLQIFDIVFGQYSQTVDGLLSESVTTSIASMLNGTRPAEEQEQDTLVVTAESVEGAVDDVASGVSFAPQIRGATYEAAMDWFGFVPQDRAAYSAQPAGPDVYPEYGEDTSVGGEMQYRPGSLVAALVLA